VHVVGAWSLPRGRDTRRREIAFRNVIRSKTCTVKLPADTCPGPGHWRVRRHGIDCAAGRKPASAICAATAAGSQRAHFELSNDLEIRRDVFKGEIPNRLAPFGCGDHDRGSYARQTFRGTTRRRPLSLRANSKRTRCAPAARRTEKKHHVWLRTAARLCCAGRAPRTAELVGHAW